MKVVIAGSSGLVGSALTKIFVNAGHEVVGINRSVIDLLDLTSTIAVSYTHLTLPTKA